MLGATLGQYRILEEIGRGGMAVVYRAYHPALDRSVAIKALPRELSLDPAFVQRFLREARSAAKLSHPNIVTIHDVCQSEGSYFIVMEYIDGPSVADLLRYEGAVAAPKAASILAQVASALDYAHARNFIHRDIKPANILLEARKTAKLTDFGIVKKAAEATRLTRTGTLLGTPAYMSPEQARGNAITTRTDIYSLGVVAYEMLSGRVPFSGDTPAVLHAHAYDAPDLSTVPDHLRCAVRNALEKEPTDRYVTAGGFAEAFKGAVETSAADLPQQRLGRSEVTDRARVPLWLWGIGGAVATLVFVLLFLLVPNEGAHTRLIETSEPTMTLRSITPSPVTEELLDLMPSEALDSASITATPGLYRGDLLLAERETQILSDLLYREANGEVIFAYRAEEAPTIDGDLNDWKEKTYGIPYVVHDPDGHWEGPLDLAASFSVQWDEGHLYIGVKVTDDIHVQIGAGDIIWEGDYVEVQFGVTSLSKLDDSRLGPDHFQIGFSPGDFQSLHPEAYIWRPLHLERSGTRIAVAAQQTSTGYNLEAAVPWWVLGGPPLVETAVGFCVNVSDNDVAGTAQQQTMISTSPNRKFGDPTTWGTFVLVDPGW